MSRAHALLIVLLLAGCRPVEASTDPEALGYGPGPHFDLATGYTVDPVSRPSPTPWTPPEREGGAEQIIDFVPHLPSAPEPVPFAADVIGVCDHLATFGDADSDRDACLRHYRAARVFRTIGDWKTLAACVGASSDRASASACEVTTPAAFEVGAAYPRESKACVYLFALLIVEEMGVEPMFERQEIVDFEPAVRECVDSLVQESRKGRTPSEYAEMLDCIERSATSDEAEACEAKE